MRQMWLVKDFVKELTLSHQGAYKVHRVRFEYELLIKITSHVPLMVSTV
jgi:hypothetical protein